MQIIQDLEQWLQNVAYIQLVSHNSIGFHKQNIMNLQLSTGVNLELIGRLKLIEDIHIAVLIHSIMFGFN